MAAERRDKVVEAVKGEAGRCATSEAESTAASAVPRKKINAVWLLLTRWVASFVSADDLIPEVEAGKGNIPGITPLNKCGVIFCP